MAFVSVHPLTHIRESALLRAGRDAAGRLRRRRDLTAEQRAHRYVSRMPVAVVTASLGGHPMRAGNPYW